MSKIIEANVIVNGVALSAAQVMTLRVALSGFLTGLTTDGLGTDDHGCRMTRAYLDRGREVESMLVNPLNRHGT